MSKHPFFYSSKLVLTATLCNLACAPQASEDEASGETTSSASGDGDGDGDTSGDGDGDASGDGDGDGDTDPSGDGDGDASGDGDGDPSPEGHVFSVRFINATNGPVTVWLEGSQPPCSAAQALACDSRPGGEPWLPADYAARWAELETDGVFEASGTRFTLIHADSGTTELPVSNHTEIGPGQVLRITPPIVDDLPQWYWASDGEAVSAGVKAWVTQAGVDMPASEQALLYEFNLTGDQLWWDLSAVDGLNANAVMSYGGPGCPDADCGCDSGNAKQCLIELAPYDGGNDGCPYIINYGGADTCPNPKFYAEIDAMVAKPGWVVPTSAFTTDAVASDYLDIWTAAGSPSGADMASAPSGDPNVKPAYHIWWSTNPVGQGWLDYLQSNDAGPCNAYGWAYDEKKWAPGDEFDQNGNPPDNIGVAANVRCDFSPDTYLGVEILSVM